MMFCLLDVFQCFGFYNLDKNHCTGMGREYFHRRETQECDARCLIQNV